MEMAAMEAELADVCGEYQTAAALSGVWNLELVAGRGYLDRLMGNVRVVKYLAQYFPERFAQFQSILESSIHRLHHAWPQRGER